MTVITKNRETYTQRIEFDENRFLKFMKEIVEDTDHKFEQEDIDLITNSVVSFVKSKKEIAAERLFDIIIREANNMITKEKPYFIWLSATALRRKLYKIASKVRGFNYHEGYGDYYSLIKKMVEQGTYSENLITKYTKEEIDELGKVIDPSLDKLFSHSGLQLLITTYLKQDLQKRTVELPQERFMTVALDLLQNEKKEDRLNLIKRAYYHLSNHHIGLATPTLKNAGTPHGTLSSCHIVTPDDDLKSIFRSNEQVARFSQNGAGLGTFLGDLRSNGSWIRGIEGAASGVVHPSRMLSVLAEYVNQLNTRKAGIAVYLPVHHFDIFDFIELRLKTGTQEKRAHSIKTAVCLPDEYMRRLKKRGLWTIFDPYEVKKKMGIKINELYDKKRLKDDEEPNKIDHAFTYHYRLIENNNDLKLKKTVQATDIYRAIYDARKTGGTPYLYWSDTSARLNPNGHVGMPKGSNLC